MTTIGNTRDGTDDVTERMVEPGTTDAHSRNLGLVSAADLDTEPRDLLERRQQCGKRSQTCNPCIARYADHRGDQDDV